MERRRSAEAAVRPGPCENTTAVLVFRTPYECTSCGELSTIMKVHLSAIIRGFSRGE